MNRIEQPLKENIIKACRLLFSPDRDFSFNFINNLELSQIKTAYRNRVFETHPDRSRLLGMNKRLLEERFKEVTLAYSKLNSFIMNEKNKIKKNQRFSSDYKKRYTKPINKKRFELLIGQYLYYSGIISFKILLEAILWQRNQRAQYGRIAADWKILSSNDIYKILKNKRYREKFGECAFRLGLLNSAQHKAIISKQKKKQRPIGEYFISNGIISPNDFEIMIKKLKEHNERLIKN